MLTKAIAVIEALLMVIAKPAGSGLPYRFEWSTTTSKPGMAQYDDIPTQTVGMHIGSSNLNKFKRRPYTRFSVCDCRCLRFQVLAQGDGATDIEYEQLNG